MGEVLPAPTTIGCIGVKVLNNAPFFKRSSVLCGKKTFDVADLLYQVRWYGVWAIPPFLVLPGKAYKLDHFVRESSKMGDGYEENPNQTQKYYLSFEV